jgi:hypothetical protein
MISSLIFAVAGLGPPSTRMDSDEDVRHQVLFQSSHKLHHRMTLASHPPSVR